MANSGQSFREFEQAGWEESSVVTKYHEHLSKQHCETALPLTSVATTSKCRCPPYLRQQQSHDAQPSLAPDAQPAALRLLVSRR